MDQNRIIMNFSAPPTLEDFETIATAQIEVLPEEIMQQCEELTLQIEDFPDEATMAEMDVEDPYELVALYRSGKEISPGVQRKIAGGDDVLILYRRPILDLWCETQDDLTALIREVMIEEMAGSFDFAEDDILEMTSRHYQGML